MTKAVENYFMAVLVVIVGLLLYSMMNESERPAAPQPPAWYEGGTLHRGTVAEWRNATPRNRLATSADFASSILKPSTVEEVREPAREMMACITATTDADSIPPNMAVSEIGAVCGVLLGW